MTTLSSQISTAIAGMTYMSESDGSVSLLDWPQVATTENLQTAIESTLKIPIAQQNIVDTDAFLAEINRMANPSQPAMQAYVKQWNDLFALLKTNAPEIVLVKAGHIDLTIIIASLGKAENIILQTKASET